MKKIAKTTNKTLSFIFAENTITGLLIVFAIAFIASLFNKYIQNDEAWFGEEAYWLLKEGVVKMKTLPLTLDYHIRVFMYYKLFIYFGSALIALFGWNLLPLKIFILVLYLLLVYLIFRFSAKQNLFKQHAKLTALMFVSAPLLIDQAFMFRPEVPVALFGFISFIFLYKNTKQQNNKNAIWAGVFSGLSFLTHPNGSAFVAAGFFFLITYKQYRSLIIYSIVAFLVSILFFFDFIDQEVAKGFIYNFQHWPGKLDEPKMNIFIQRLLQLLNEQQRFFWSLRVQSISALFVLALIFNFKKLNANIPETLRYLLILILCSNILGGNFAERYLTYYLPFMAIIISAGVFHLIQKKSAVLAGIFTLIFIFHIYANVNMFSFIFGKSFNHKKEHKQLAQHITPNSRVLSPWDFIYNEIDNYEIFSYKNIEYYNYQEVNNTELIGILDTLNIDYVIVTERLSDIIQYDLDSIRLKGIGNYSPTFVDEKYAILKLKE